MLWNYLTEVSFNWSLFLNMQKWFYWRIVICCFYIHTKKPNDYDSNFIIIHCEITHKKEYLSICARNWSLNMHSHKIDSLHFISTYTLNSRGGGAIWDGWDMSPKCSLALFEQYLAMKVVIFYNNKPKRVFGL